MSGFLNYYTRTFRITFDFYLTFQCTCKALTGMQLVKYKFDKFKQSIGY